MYNTNGLFVFFCFFPPPSSLSDSLFTVKNACDMFILYFICIYIKINKLCTINFHFAFFFFPEVVEVEVLKN